jgi:hypothetical protein
VPFPSDEEEVKDAVSSFRRFEMETSHYEKLSILSQHHLHDAPKVVNDVLRTIFLPT